MLNMNTDLQEVVVSVLHPHGPSPLFVYPEQSDILSVFSSDILCMVGPSTATGQACTVSEKKIWSGLIL